MLGLLLLGAKTLQASSTAEWLVLSAERCDVTVPNLAALVSILEGRFALPLSQVSGATLLETIKFKNCFFLCLKIDSAFFQLLVKFDLPSYF